MCSPFSAAEAYRNAAARSAGVSWGYWAKICSCVAPLAASSRRNSALTGVPRTQGFPPRISHIRIDAKRQALDALNVARRGEVGNGNAGNGNAEAANTAEIEAVVEVSDDLTSQSRHSLLLQGSTPSGKLLIPLAR